MNPLTWWRERKQRKDKETMKKNLEDVNKIYNYILDEAELGNTQPIKFYIIHTYMQIQHFSSEIASELPNHFIKNVMKN